MKEQMWFKFYMALPSSLQVKRLDWIFGAHFTIDVYMRLLTLLYGEFSNSISWSDEQTRLLVAEFCGTDECTLERFIDETARPMVGWFNTDRWNMGVLTSDGVAKALEEAKAAKIKGRAGGLKMQAKNKEKQEE